MPRKSVEPVSAFGPELLAALIKGGESPLRVEFPDFNSAFALRQRLYALRKAMRDEKHPQTSIAYRASVALPKQETSPEGTARWILLIRPKDDHFSAPLRRAGVTLPTLPDSTLSIEPPTSEPIDIDPDESSDWLDNILKGV